MIITIVILSLCLIGSLYANWNLLRKVERLQDFSDQLSKWVDNLNQISARIITQLDVIDEKGIFKSDDYVGTMWKEIEALVRQLDNVIIKETENADDSNS